MSKPPCTGFGTGRLDLFAVIKGPSAEIILFLHTKIVYCFDIAISLALTGQAQHHHCRIRAPGGLDSLGNQRLIHAALGLKAVGVFVFDPPLIQRIAQAGELGG